MLHTDLVTGRAREHRASDSMTPGGDRDEVTLERLQGAVAELLYAISGAMQGDREVFGKSIRCAVELLDLEVRDGSTEATEAPSSTASTSLRGGLAPFQVSKVRNFIEANLNSTIRVKDLAALANLSRYHFSRAFRQSFGDTPHAYVMRRRIERAQGLMLTSDVPLAQIALECGLADQAAFTRLFRRVVGETPGVWRRARAALELARRTKSQHDDAIQPRSFGR